MHRCRAQGQDKIKGVLAVTALKHWCQSVEPKRRLAPSNTHPSSVSYGATVNSMRGIARDG
jgi:hypothetical protein